MLNIERCLLYLRRIHSDLVKPSLQIKSRENVCAPDTQTSHHIWYGHIILLSYAVESSIVHKSSQFIQFLHEER